MLPSRHIIVSLSLGTLLWLFTRSAVNAMLCFASGVLIDLDHFIEYVLHYGLKGFGLKEFYRDCIKLQKRQGEGRIKKVYIIFHTIEVVILLWTAVVLTQNLHLLSIAIGYTAHIIMDLLANPMKPEAYFLAVRIKNRFRTAQLAATP